MILFLFLWSTSLTKGSSKFLYCDKFNFSDNPALLRAIRRCETFRFISWLYYHHASQTWHVYFKTNSKKQVQNLWQCWTMRQEEGSEGFGSHIKNLGMKTIAERSAVQVNIDTITWYQWINIWFCFSSSLSRVFFF